MSEGAVLGVCKSTTDRRWCWRHGDALDEEAASRIVRRHNLPDVLARLLLSRGIDESDVERHLNPTLRSFCPDPYVLQDMKKAAERLARAIQAGENVAILGDYDVDGTTSCALLSHFLSSVRGNLSINYIPDRIKEGYGPSERAMIVLKEAGATLVVTVDCGTCAHAALARARGLGLDVIVVDHHQVSSDPPLCHAFVNPQRPDDTSCLKVLAAVGLVYMLVIATNRLLREMGHYRQGLSEPDLLTWIDIVALGTVCDMVPLVGLNRAFVRQGLLRMAQNPNPGISALLSASGVLESPTTYHLGFVLGPRINAGGRIGQAHMGFRLLTAPSLQERENLARQLQALNFERQSIENDTLLEARGMVEAQMADLKSFPPIIVVQKENWHIGVIGIVASRLMALYGRPSLVIAFDQNGVGKGSGRSIPGIDLGRLIHEGVEKGVLLAGGGHAMAVGFSLRRDSCTAFSRFAEERLAPFFVDYTPQLAIDGLLSLESVGNSLVDLLESAGPYGSGYPTPRFVFPDVSVVSSRIVGRDHVSCLLMSEKTGKCLRAISFRSSCSPLGRALLNKRGRYHVAGYVNKNRWQQRENVQVVIEDVAALV